MGGDDGYRTSWMAGKVFADHMKMALSVFLTLLLILLSLCMLGAIRGTACINSGQEKAAFPREQFLNYPYSFLQFPIHLLLIKIQTNKQKNLSFVS